jgi:TRAP-type C4-dicarboxylate transport system substrate-binding protein
VECFDTVSEESVELLQQETEAALQKLREKGNKFIELTPEEMASWGEYVNDINQEWIEETEAKGLPARDTFEEMMRLAKEYW